MGITTDELRILLSVNGASSYVNQMQQVTRATGGFDNAAGKLISTLAKLVSVGAIVKFGKQCIEAASDLQEVANVMNVTFGESAVLVDKWAKTQAASFGLSETAAKRYIGTYGTMATQFGYTREQAASMGIELTKLTGDVASFYNIEDKLAAVKLKSVFTGETETLKELGVVMTEVNLNAYAMEKGLGKTLKEMTEHEKVALRYSFVMDKLSHAQGDFARTSDGWANSVRKLKLNLENLKIQVGNELLPIAAQGLALVNKGLQVLSPILVGVAKTVRYYGEAWKNASDQTKGLVKAAFSFVAIGAIIPKLIAMVQGAITLLTARIVGLNGALSATMGILGIVLGAIAFKQLTDQMKELKKASETAESIADIGTSAETSSNAVNDLSEAMNGLGSATEGLDTFLASFDEVNKVGGNNSLMSNLVNTEDLANILGVADGLGDIKGMIGELNSSISDMSLPDISLPDISENTFLDPKWWRKKWRSVKSAIIEYLKTFFDGSWKENWNIGLDMIGEWFEEHLPNWSAFWERVGSVFAMVFEPVKTALHEISDLFDTITQKIENSAWFKFFANAGSNLYDLQHENDAEKNDTFMYTSKSGVTRPALKYNTDGSETELYKKYKSMYNEDGTETELNKRLNRSYTLNQPNIPNLSQTMNATYQQPNTTIINNYTTPEKKEEKETTVEFSPTIQIDGRTISSIVINEINKRTRSSGKSPLIELGG